MGEFEELLKKSKQGDLDAQIELGNCYYNGKGVEQDYLEAVKWYLKAANQGNASSQDMLGDCYYYGYGVEQDYLEAVKWYSKAANQGNKWSQNSLGNCYYNGKGVEQDYKKAVEWYSKAANQGNASAQKNLGDCYYSGEGIYQDYKEAVKWYWEAANQGNASAQDMLGDCYYYGYGVAENEDEAIKWYRSAASQGNQYSQCSLGEYYYKLTLYNDAVAWFKDSAKQGNSRAQKWLGDCYKDGIGIERNPYEAVKWYEKSGIVSRDLIEELKVPTIIIKEDIGNRHFKFSDADIEIFKVMRNGDTYAIEITCYYMPINYTLSYKVVKNVGFDFFEEECEEEAFSLKWGEWDGNKISLLVKRINEDLEYGQLYVSILCEDVGIETKVRLNIVEKEPEDEEEYQGLFSMILLNSLD